MTRRIAIVALLLPLFACSREKEVASATPSAQVAGTPQLEGLDFAWVLEHREACKRGDVATLLETEPPPRQHPTASAAAIAHCWLLAGRMDEARGVLQSGSMLDRDRAALSLTFSMHYVTEDDPMSARIASLSLEVHPDDPMALYRSGRWEYLFGDRELGRKRLGRLLEIYSDRETRRRIQDVLDSKP